MGETPKWSRGSKERYEGPWSRNVQIKGVQMIEHFDGDGQYSYSEVPIHARLLPDVIKGLIDRTKFVNGSYDETSEAAVPKDQEQE